MNRPSFTLHGQGMTYANGREVHYSELISSPHSDFKPCPLNKGDESSIAIKVFCKYSDGEKCYKNLVTIPTLLGKTTPDIYIFALHRFHYDLNTCLYDYVNIRFSSVILEHFDAIGTEMTVHTYLHSYGDRNWKSAKIDRWDFSGDDYNMHSAPIVPGENETVNLWNAIGKLVREWKIKTRYAEPIPEKPITERQRLHDKYGRRVLEYYRIDKRQMDYAFGDDYDELFRDNETLKNTIEMITHDQIWNGYRPAGVWMRGYNSPDGWYEGFITFTGHSHSGWKRLYEIGFGCNELGRPEPFEEVEKTDDFYCNLTGRGLAYFDDSINTVCLIVKDTLPESNTLFNFDDHKRSGFAIVKVPIEVLPHLSLMCWKDETGTLHIGFVAKIHDSEKGWIDYYPKWERLPCFANPFALKDPNAPPERATPEVIEYLKSIFGDD